MGVTCCLPLCVSDKLSSLRCPYPPALTCPVPNIAEFNKDPNGLHIKDNKEGFFFGSDTLISPGNRVPTGKEHLLQGVGGRQGAECLILGQWSTPISQKYLLTVSVTTTQSWSEALGAGLAVTQHTYSRARAATLAVLKTNICQYNTPRLLTSEHLRKPGRPIRRVGMYKWLAELRYTSNTRYATCTVLSHSAVQIHFKTRDWFGAKMTEHVCFGSRHRFWVIDRNVKHYSPPCCGAEVEDYMEDACAACLSVICAIVQTGLLTNLVWGRFRTMRRPSACGVHACGQGRSPL